MTETATNTHLDSEFWTINQYTHKWLIPDKCKKEKVIFVTTKLMDNLAKCMISKWSFLQISFFLLEIFLSLLDTLRSENAFKNLHIYSLQLSQSCEQEDFNSSSKFLHLTGLIIKQSYLLYQRRFSSLFGFFWIFFLLQKGSLLGRI